MTLQTNVTDYVVANPSKTAEEVLTHINGLSISSIVISNTSQAKTGIATVDLLNNTVDRLEAYTPPEDMEEDFKAPALDVARKLVRAFSMLFSPEFYVNLNVVEVKGLFDAALFLGVITQAEYDGIMAAVTVNDTPYVNTTLTQVKAIMTPASKQLCEHLDGSQEFVVSASVQDKFIFIIDAVDSIGKLQLHLEWNDGTDTTNFITHAVGNLQGGQGVYSVMMTKPQGLSRGRYFKFSFTEEYAGQLNSVNVNLG